MFKVGHCRQIERLSCRAAPWHFCNFPALAGLISHPQEGHVLFDTGYSPKFFEETRNFPERAYRMATPVSLQPRENLAVQLSARGIDPGEIRAIILSHFHADHISGVVDFPHAALLCATAGWEAIKNTGRFSGVRRGLIPGLLPDDFARRARFIEDLKIVPLPLDLAPFETGYDLFGDNSLIAVSLPGHADGQFGLCFSDTDGQKVFLVADAAWSMQAVRDNAPPMKIADRMLHHTTAYPETLRNLHNLHLRNSEVLIVPSHCRERQTELIGASL